MVRTRTVTDRWPSVFGRLRLISWPIPKETDVFPSKRVFRIIDGRDVRSHSDRDMPVTGDAFRSEPDGLTADEVKARKRRGAD